MHISYTYLHPDTARERYASLRLFLTLGSWLAYMHPSPKSINPYTSFAITADRVNFIPNEYLPPIKQFCLFINREALSYTILGMVDETIYTHVFFLHFLSVSETIEPLGETPERSETFFLRQFFKWLIRNGMCEILNSPVP